MDKKKKGDSLTRLKIVLWLVRLKELRLMSKGGEGGMGELEKEEWL